MDILVREKTGHHPAARPGEARVWGLVAAAVVLGLILLVGVFERTDRVQMASSDPVIMQRAPAPLVPDPVP